jgi:hypothetical protein
MYPTYKAEWRRIRVEGGRDSKMKTRVYSREAVGQSWMIPFPVLSCKFIQVPFIPFSLLYFPVSCIDVIGGSVTRKKKKPTVDQQNVPPCDNQSVIRLHFFPHKYSFVFII